MTLQRKQQGFTIVELLIVIVVIGILAALVITTFTGIQQRARNTERETDIKALHSQLEAYFAIHNRYPLPADVNNATWRDTNMKGLDEGALADPRLADGTTAELKTTAEDGFYVYAVTAEGGGVCDNTSAATDCVEYTLEATLEGGGTFTKDSLN